MRTLISPSARDMTLLPGKAVTGSPVKGSRLAPLRSLGILPGISGGARGYNASGDVLTRTEDGESLNDIWNEFQQSLEFYNERRQALIDLLSFSVTQLVERVGIPGGEQDFERASEFGEPVGIRTRIAFQELGYDFAWYDLGIRFTWMFLSEAEASQVSSLNASAMNADTRMLFRKVMEAIFRNVNRSATVGGQTEVGPGGQTVTVYPFYNGDGWTPPRFKNFEFDGTHSHYLTTGSVGLDSEDVDAIITHLRHHGYGDTPGAAQILILANDQEVAQMRSWRIADGDSYDFIPPAGTTFPRFLIDSNQGIEGGQPPQTIAGMEVAGQYGPAIVLQESWIPAGYLFGFATGGTETPENPVGIREHRNTALRGLRLVKGRTPDYPLIDSFYQRGFGTGIRHRGNGVVLQVTEGSTYSPPAEYANVA